MVKAAKKRKKDEDEEFRFPEFDEQEYLRKEIELSKSTFVTLGLAVPVAVILYGLTLVQIPIIAFFVGMAATFALPRIFRLLPWPKLDLGKFERKDWVGQGGTFLLAWLTIWILLLNVPFTDVTPPVFAGVTASDGTLPELAITPNVQNSHVYNGTVWINASVFENGRLEGVSIDIPGSSSRAMSPVAGAPTTWSITVLLPPGTPTLTVNARDHAGLETTFSFVLEVRLRPP